MMRIAWLALLVFFSTGGIQAQTADAPLQVDLDIRALAGPLRDLNPEEEQAVEEAIELIRHGEHTLALLSLARLTGRNPNNSALRVLRAYVLLQLGNLLGALDDARAAEGGRIRSAYRCWFLAQVAYLAGDRPLCKREARHLAGNPSYGRKAEDLARKLAARTKQGLEIYSRPRCPLTAAASPLCAPWPPSAPEGSSAATRVSPPTCTAWRK